MFHMSRRYLHQLVLVFLLIGMVFTGACAAPAPTQTETEEESLPVEAGTPESVVAYFIRDLNSALNDPAIVEQEPRRQWAGRLANYFAPGERMTHRRSLALMLANVAASMQELETNQKLTVELTYSSIELTEQNDERAYVRIVDGWLRLKKVQLEPDGRQTIVRDQGRPLSDIIGDYSGDLPLVWSSGRWCITER